MGLSGVSGYVLMFFHLVESHFFSDRVFSGPSGALQLHLLQTIPALLTAILMGFVAAYFLTFRYAEWALLLLGAIWSVSHFYSVQYFVQPERSQVAIQVSQAILIPLLLVVTFLAKRRLIRRASKHECPDA